MDKWTHVACVLDTSASTYGTQYVYTNGVLAASLEMDNPFVANPGGTFNIGDRDYSGFLDEVAVYDTALAPSDLAGHYQAGISGSGSYRAAVLAKTPVGYWRLNETAGFNATPTAAQNAGTLGVRENGTYDMGTKLQQPGALVASTNKAAYFDGAHSMQAPAGQAANPNAPFSVEFWAKPGNDYAGLGTAQAVPLGATDRDFGRSGWLFYQGGNGWSWWLGDTAAYTIQLDPTTPVSTANWYHVVGTYDGTTARLYVNGIEVANKTGAFAPNSTKAITIGARYDASYYYVGSIDEVAIYPIVLPAADVLAHYQNGTSAAPSQTYDSLVLAQNPLSYWRLNEPASSSSSGVANSGFLGSAVDGQVVGTVEITSDSPLVGDSNAAMNFTPGGRIAVPFDPMLNRTNAFSYEIWYKEDGGASGIRCPLWWRDEPGAGDTRGWVHYTWDSWDPAWNGRGHVFQSSDTITTWNGLGSATLFAQDEWQHLVCTFDGKTKRIYLNAVLIEASTNAYLAVKPVQRPVTTISSASYPFLGLLDEAAYYTNALSADRVQAHWLAARKTAPPAVAPTFKVQPLGLSGFEGSSVSLNALVLGTPPFTYQWFKGTTSLAGKTNSTLTLSPAAQSGTGDYTVKVTNTGGQTTSDVAHLDIVAAPPTIIQDPKPANRLQGANVTFAVTAAGSEPLTYQWKSNSVDIVGATASTLTLTDVQPSFAASYSVTVKNGAGTINSQAASLTVVPVVAGGFAASVVADMPAGFWRLDESSGTVAHDLVGGHDGTYEDGLTLGATGALSGDTDKAVTFAGSSGIVVPFSQALNPDPAFSLECWVRPDPTGAGTSRAILSSRNTWSGWHYGYFLSANAGDQWQFTTGHKTSGTSSLVGGSTTEQVWYHIVATFDGVTGDKRLYVNGALLTNVTESVGTFAPNYPWPNDTPPAADEGIGKTTALEAYEGEGNYFVGDLDEVVIYNYVLTPAQVAQHHGGMPTLSISTTGGNVAITWASGLLLQATDIKGPWTTNTTAVSPWSFTPTGAQQFFRVVAP